MQTAMDSLSEALLELYIEEAIDWEPTETFLRHIADKGSASQEEADKGILFFKKAFDLAKTLQNMGE